LANRRWKRFARSGSGRDIVWIATRDLSRGVEAAASNVERVRALLHRQPLSVDGFSWVMAECSGPTVADEQDAYGRIVTVKLTLEEV